MQPTNELKIEHDAVLNVLEILDKLSQKITQGQEINSDDLEILLNVLREFVDRCHHGKEEKILFEALESVGIPKQGGPVGVMLYEHDNGRGFIKGMREAFEEYKQGNIKALQRFASNASQYAALMKDHIDKENNILYPMAEMHLSNTEKTKMAQDFADIQAQETGDGRYEKHLQTIEQLKSRYL